MLFNRSPGTHFPGLGATNPENEFPGYGGRAANPENEFPGYDEIEWKKKS
jgi:hypothetical protein